MKNDSRFHLILFFIFIISILWPSFIKDTQGEENIKLIENISDFNPYVFNIHDHNNYNLSGILTVENNQNDTTSIFYRTFNGQSLSIPIEIYTAPGQNKCYSPIGYNINRTNYYFWVVISNDSYSILTRKHNLETGLGDISFPVKNLSVSIDYQITTFKIAYTNNSLFVFFNRDIDWIHYIVYDIDSGKFSEMMPLYESSNAGSNDEKIECRGIMNYLYQMENDFLISYVRSGGSNSYGELPVQLIKFNLSHPGIIDLDDDLLLKKYYYTENPHTYRESLGALKLGANLILSMPFSSRSDDNWTITCIDSNNSNKSSFNIDINKNQFLKCIIVPYGPRICIMYLAETGTNKCQAYYSWYVPGEELNFKELGTQYSFDDSIMDKVFQTKLFISINEIVCADYRYMTYFYVEKDDITGLYHLKTEVIDKRPVRVCNIEISNNSIYTYDSISISAFSSNGDIANLKYHYDFGDGNETGWIINQRMSYYYIDQGNYEIGVKIKDEMNFESNIQYSIVTVLNRPPNIDDIISSPVNAFTFDIVEMTANVSDIDGMISAINWSFGDGTSCSTLIARHPYLKSGTYNVTLRITDDDFESNETQTQIKIFNRPPIANATFRSRAIMNEKVSLDASGSTDEDGKITSWRWTVEGRTIDGMTINYSFRNRGTQVVTLTVTDDEGAMAQQTSKIFIEESKNSPMINILAVSIIFLIIGCVLIGIIILKRRQNSVKK